MTGPTRHEYESAVVADQLTAFTIWDRDSNLPDVLRRADFLARPDLVGRVIAARASDRRGPEPLLVLPYPKDDGTQRTTCQLDPFDDVAFALLISAIAEKTESALPR